MSPRETKPPGGPEQQQNSLEQRRVRLERMVKKWADIVAHLKWSVKWCFKLLFEIKGAKGGPTLKFLSPQYLKIQLFLERLHNVVQTSSDRLAQAAEKIEGEEEFVDEFDLWFNRLHAIDSDFIFESESREPELQRQAAQAFLLRLDNIILLTQETFRKRKFFKK